MIETKYTPGPWIVEDEEFSAAGDYTEPQVFSCVDEDNPKIICSLAVRNNMKANAILISAAPDMLAALQALGVHPEDGYCWCKKFDVNCTTRECIEARKAIAKAEGKVRP